MRNNKAYALKVVPQPAKDTPASVLPAALLLDTIGRGVIFVNVDGVLIFMNRYATELLPVWEENIIGKRVDMLPLGAPIYKVLSEECRGIPLEMVIKGRIVAAQSSEVRSGSGALCGEMTEIWDMTEEKRAKREREEFVTMMTHELRSPLTTVLGYIQGMQCGMFGEISTLLRTVVEKAEESGKKLNFMIEEMLDDFRLEMGLMNLNRQNCDMEKLLEECYHDNLRAAQTQGVNLELKQQEGLPELYVDGRQLIRVFNNLIGNAIKFTPDSGKVSIIAERDKDSLHVVVADTGIGIPPEDHSRVFFKFYRSAGASGFRGSGLGLAIGKTIVEAHGGSIELESSIGAGSRFKVSLPFSTMENNEPAYH